MKEDNVTWKIFAVYLFVLAFMLFCGTAFGQVKVVHYNAEWNNTNKVKWLNKLTDCKIGYIDISKKPDIQKKREIVVVPTIIVFKDGEEVKRYQADISFTMQATRKEIQEYIDELLMEDF